MKSVNVEHARAMGQRNLGAWDPERSRKMRETLSILNAMSAEARRHYRAERKSRWLTNCIVTHPDRKTFDLAGIDPLTERRYAVHLEMPQGKRQPTPSGCPASFASRETRPAFKATVLPAHGFCPVPG